MASTAALRRTTRDKVSTRTSTACALTVPRLARSAMCAALHVRRAALAPTALRARIALVDRRTNDRSMTHSRNTGRAARVLRNAQRALPLARAVQTSRVARRRASVLRTRCAQRRAAAKKRETVADTCVTNKNAAIQPNFISPPPLNHQLRNECNRCRLRFRPPYLRRYWSISVRENAVRKLNSARSRSDNGSGSMKRS